MAELSDYLENAIIDFFLRANPGAAVTSPATVYVALFTADPLDDASGAELVPGGNTYVRQAVTFDAPANGVTQNSGVITFSDMPASTITHFALFDASTAGNMLMHSPLDASETFSAGNTATFAAGAITVTLT